jgi:hypothetical protein
MLEKYLIEECSKMTKLSSQFNKLAEDVNTTNLFDSSDGKEALRKVLANKFRNSSGGAEEKIKEIHKGESFTSIKTDTKEKKAQVDYSNAPQPQIYTEKDRASHYGQLGGMLGAGLNFGRTITNPKAVEAFKSLPGWGKAVGIAGNLGIGYGAGYLGGRIAHRVAKGPASDRPVYKTGSLKEKVAQIQMNNQQQQQPIQQPQNQGFLPRAANWINTNPGKALALTAATMGGIAGLGYGAKKLFSKTPVKPVVQSTVGKRSESEIAARIAREGEELRAQGLPTMPPQPKTGPGIDRTYIGNTPYAKPQPLEPPQLTEAMRNEKLSTPPSSTPSTPIQRTPASDKPIPPDKPYTPQKRTFTPEQINARQEELNMFHKKFGYLSDPEEVKKLTDRQLELYAGQVVNPSYYARELGEHATENHRKLITAWDNIKQELKGRGID